MGKPQFSKTGFQTDAYFHKRLFWLNNRLMVPKLTTDSLRVKDNLTVNGNASILGTASFKTEVVAVTTTKTVTVAETGTIFTLDAAGGAYTITLPTVADGAKCRWRFICI